MEKKPEPSKEIAPMEAQAVTAKEFKWAIYQIEKRIKSYEDQCDAIMDELNSQRILLAQVNMKFVDYKRNKLFDNKKVSKTDTQ